MLPPLLQPSGRRAEYSPQTESDQRPEHRSSRTAGAPILKDLGITKTQSSREQQLADTPDRRFENHESTKSGGIMWKAGQIIYRKSTGRQGSVRPAGGLHAMSNRFSRWIQNTTETGRRERAWAAWSAAPEGHRSGQFRYVQRDVAHDVEFRKRQPVRDFFRGVVERSRVKITNTVDRGRSRRAYAEFDRVANLSNDLFEAAMLGGREHDRTDIAKWRDFLRGISPQSQAEIQRQEDDKEAEWRQMSLPEIQNR
jgi:hypothetical protein